MIRRSYSFSAHGNCAASGYELDALCIYFDAKRPLTRLEFFDELLTSLQSMSALPDCIVVISDEDDSEVLYQHWMEDSKQRETFQQRGSRNGVHFIKDYYFVAWGAKTGLNVVHRYNTENTANLKLPINDFVVQGMGSLVEKNPVVDLAPSGHIFKHPSGRTDKLFIRARELAASEVELAFIGRCIARWLLALHDPDVRVVYIDTMGVYPFVREALNFAESSACIYSYHSYKELSELSPPTESYAVVISASTSGGMAKKLSLEQLFDSERLLTLVDVSRYERYGQVLVALEDVNQKYRQPPSDSMESRIELIGEHFSAKAKPPRRVTLGMPHRPKKLITFLEEFGIDGVLSLNNPPEAKAKLRLIDVSRSTVGANQRLLRWLDAEVTWHVSVAIDHIVHAGDKGSAALAENAARKLNQLKESSEHTKIIAYPDVDDTTLKHARGVLVVQAVVGDGGVLREISRDFREYLGSSVPRHFLAGVGLPQTRQTWQRLRQFLVKNTSPREYGFSEWLVLPVGPDGTNNAWNALNRLIEKVQTNDCGSEAANKQVLEESLDKAVELVRGSYRGFLGTNTGCELGLSEGFVFFGNAFTIDEIPKVSKATAYLTVASVLQAARELDDPIRQLRPSGYESVVLSPENFLRFNDNLFQASILRAARASELDYSSDPNLSRLMKEFLLKMFRRNRHPYGAASLEFAAAMACGRLKLTYDDSNELREEAIRDLSEESSALLGFILLMQ